MKHHSKATFAGSTDGTGIDRGLFRRAFATRGVSSDSNGSGARSRLRGALALVALVICALGLTAAPASASEASAPGVVMGTVSNVNGGGAHVTGEVDARAHNGDAYTFYSFEYSTDEVNWTKANTAVSTSDQLEPVSYDLVELKASTKYFVRLSASDIVHPEVFSAGPNPSFTTLPVDPPAVLAVDDATGIFATSANVSGEVERPAPANHDPGFDVRCTFEYISDAQFTANEANSEPGFTGAGQWPCTPDPVTFADPPEVTATISYLSPGTTYHLRLAARNSGGSDVKAATNTFTTNTLAPPTVSIDPVLDATATTAHFFGNVNPNSADPAAETYWHFQCTPECPQLSGGTFGNGGGVVSPPTNSGTDVGAYATGLEPNTTYQVELVADNNGGGHSSTQATFQTLPVGPIGETIPAFVPGSGTEALIGGKVNPKNSATTYWFEYGPGPGGSSPAYPSSIPASKDASAGSGGKSIVVTQKLTGLAPGSTYHYRLVAENASGTLEGEDVDVTIPLPPSAPSDCPNVKLRTETSSGSLGECRAYEMTTAPEKNGGDVTFTLAASPSGERIGYTSTAAFADSKANAVTSAFIGIRGPSGWGVRSMTPPLGAPGLALAGGYQIPDFSTDLSRAIFPVSRNVAGEPNLPNVLMSDIDGTWTVVTAPTIPPASLFGKAYVGRSADGSRIFFESFQPFVAGVKGGNQIYEWHEGQVRLVSIKPGTKKTPFPDATVGSAKNRDGGLGTSFSGGVEQPTVVSADGSRIFFARSYGGNASGVYVREGGTETRELSASQRAGSIEQPSSDAKFVMAAIDGSRVYMSSAEQLTDDAPPGGGLYSYNLETEEMHFIAAGPYDGGLRVSLVSSDGSRVYFVSTAQLVPGHGTAGLNNLYTTDERGDGLTFVATVGAEEPRTPKVTPDGSHFTFASNAQLTAFDNAGHREIYLFDLGTDTLRCVSCGTEIHVATGDAGLMASPPTGETIGRPRGITDDGSRVFFQTNESLVPQDANGVKDVYQYEDGALSLISTGSSPYPSEIADISTDGSNVLFSTRDSLVGQDIDGGSLDVYDARINGGFPAPVGEEVCEGASACQRAPGVAPSFTSPGTASLTSRGNTDKRGKKKPQKTCKQKSKKKRAQCKSKAKKHQANKHQTKKASKSGRGK